jgi:hypothetical protein
MLIQLVYGLLSGISITVLKDAYGSFTRAIHLDELIVVALPLPGENVLPKFIPP